MKNLKSSFANKIKALRKQRNLTQNELAQLCGISTSFLSNMERGLNAPSFDVLESLAKALKVQVKDLFDFENSGG
jgi:transcriptional regulator with XRE-family HTH domain